MSNFLILNGAQPYPFAPGGLNATLAERVAMWLEAQGYAVRLTPAAEGYDVDGEPFSSKALAEHLALMPQALESEFGRLIASRAIARRGDFVTILNRAQLWEERARGKARARPGDDA